MHYHARYHETFFITKGAINLFVEDETRRLGPLDFGSVPVGTNHSFQVLEPDTEGVGFITPGGVTFYVAAGTPYSSEVLAPFIPNNPPPINLERVEDATGSFYDYHPVDYPSNYNVVNGTSNSS